MAWCALLPLVYSPDCRRTTEVCETPPSLSLLQLYPFQSPLLKKLHVVLEFSLSLPPASVPPFSAPFLLPLPRHTARSLPPQVVGLGDGETDVSVVHAPFSLFPTPFPGSPFTAVRDTMPLFSLLVHQVSCDEEYLQQTLAAAAQFDGFTAKLLDVLVTTAAARRALGPGVSLGLHRSDYMLDEPSGCFLQVCFCRLATRSRGCAGESTEQLCCSSC